MIGSVPYKGDRPKSGRVRALAGFLAFVLGASLTVSSLGNMGSRIVWEQDLTPRFAADWQETDRFRVDVAKYLKNFLIIGAGGRLDVYPYDSYVTYSAGDLAPDTAAAIARGEISFETVDWRRGTTYAIAGEAVDLGTEGSTALSGDTAPAVVAPEWSEREPDADYQSDKNVLYWIQSNDGTVYTNAEPDVSRFGFEERNIVGYNFYLAFEDGKVSIHDSGVTLDVYGNGVYDGDSQWFVPGYDNFPATEALDGVTVYMAVRSTPIRYHYVDYKAGSSYSRGSMYYIAQRVEESKDFYRTQVMLFGLGVLWLSAWLFLRKSTVPVNRKIASWTVHVWTEVRFLLVFLPLAGCLLLGLNYYSLWDIFYYFGWDSGITFSEVGTGILRLLTASPPALLAVFWLLWLLYNDHRYNSKEDRRSLLRPFCRVVRGVFRALRARDLKRPVEKRLSRNHMAGTLALAILALAEAVNLFAVIYHMFFIYGGISITGVMLYIQFPLLLLGIPLLPALLRAWRTRGLARDIAALADQVEAIRAGDLSRSLTLPEDADLRATADSLNDIQAGMRIALEEQTRSERMKVELISNVSHDLKTPLTSILSYAELLRQEEELPPAAADYARIIDEKAQRLKGMVEDVFEVSKAAADQLPVRLERLDLAKLLRQTLADMDGPIQASALTFRVDLPEAPAMITADGKRLYRVFQNLIDNALRYALEGSRVYLSLKTAEGTAEASVRNTSRSELPEGVDFTARFVRGDASRTDGGSGLGLSIASSFTEACGGTFRVETVADLFTAIVTFPITE